MPRPWSPRASTRVKEFYERLLAGANRRGGIGGLSMRKPSFSTPS